jgi:hypothetical protein
MTTKRNISYAANNYDPEDRGSADAYYGRAFKPHKMIAGKKVTLTDPEEIEQYRKGYQGEQYKKDWNGNGKIYQ